MHESKRCTRSILYFSTSSKLYIIPTISVSSSSRSAFNALFLYNRSKFPIFFNFSKIIKPLPQFTMNIPPQNVVLYNNRCWRLDVDAIILDTALEHFAGRTPLPHATLDDEVLRKVCRNLENPFGRVYTGETIALRFQFLRDRFIAFKTLVETRRVHWIMRDNSIVVDEYTFRRIVERNGLSVAYYRLGDPDIVKLRLLFETEELKLNPYHVLPYVDPGPEEGCSSSPLSIADDESENETDDDVETWSSEDGSSADGKQ